MERKKAVKKCVFISHSLFYDFFRVSGLHGHLKRGNVPVWDIKPLGLLKLRVERSPAAMPTVP